MYDVLLLSISHFKSVPIWKEERGGYARELKLYVHLHKHYFKRYLKTFYRKLKLLQKVDI